jgi:hypothetical protein
LVGGEAIGRKRTNYFAYNSDGVSYTKEESIAQKEEEQKQKKPLYLTFSPTH